ncbi:hypothetical protein V8F20_005851 [Naviculisporaceae sp. PSN 640]
MKNTAIIASVAAAAALVSATDLDTGGITINPDGSYTCAKANAAYCAGDSLKTDIIIRCYGTRGVAGRCSDNLAGEPPRGLTTALCHQTDNVEGDAACEKNCVVYGGSGNGKGTFTLPAEICTPTYTATSSSATATSTSTSSPSYPTTSIETSTSTTEYPPHTKTWTHTYKPPHSTKYHWTSKEDCTTETEETKSTSYPTTFIPTTAYSQSSSGVPYTPIYPTGNVTVVTSTSTTQGVPTGPTSAPPVPSGPTDTPVPAGAVHNSAAGGALAVVAFVAAYIL